MPVSQMLTKSSPCCSCMTPVVDVCYLFKEVLEKQVDKDISPPGSPTDETTSKQVSVYRELFVKIFFRTQNSELFLFNP